MRRRGTPWVIFSVQQGNARVTEVEAPIFIDRIHIGLSRDVKGFPAYDRRIFDIYQTGYQWQLAGRTFPGLQKAPSERGSAEQTFQ